MKKFFLILIRLYQKYLSLFVSGLIYLTDRSCRFTPSCSRYTYQAILRYGIIKGVWYGTRRLLRCHPFSTGGVDILK